MTVKSVCVFCGARNTIHPEYIALAKRCGELLAEKNLAVVYGGSSSGMMQAVSQTAYRAGAKVIGVYPKILNEKEPISSEVTETMIVDSMHVRKEIMINYSDAFFVLPGGMGTLDEFFEVLTLAMIGAMKKPIIVINHNGYWNKLKDLIEQVVTEEFASSGVYDLFYFVETLDEAFKKIGC